MKSFTVIILFLLLIFFQTPEVKAQWQPSAGLEGAHAWDITLHHDSLLFITTPNGIYKRNISIDEWEKVNTIGCSSYTISNGTYLYSYGSMCYLMRSGDNGETWEEINESPLIYSIDLSGSVIILCTGDGTYRSEDNGDSWTHLGQYPDYIMCNIFICDSTVLFNDFELDTLWISHDLGITFEGLTLNGLSSSRIGDIYVEEGELYLGHHDGVFHYKASESKWLIFGDTLPEITYVNELFKYEDTLRFISNKGYFTLNPEDSSWSSNNDGLESLNMYSVDFNDSVIFAGTTKGPFYKEKNNPWQSDYDGLYQRVVYQVVQSDSLLFALTEDGLFYSVDNGGSFDLYPTLNYPDGNEMIITDSAYYLATSEGFAVSMDEGYSWTFYNEGFVGYMDIHHIAVSDLYIYALKDGLYRSLKNPINWTKILTGNCDMIAAKDSIVIMTVDGGNEALYRSVDYGLTFHTVSLPEIGVPVPRIFMNETNNKVFVLVDKPYYTSDWGETWSSYPFDAYLPNLFCIAESENVILVGGGQIVSTDCLYMSYDQGNTWSEISGGLPLFGSYPSIWQIYISGSRIIGFPDYNSSWSRDDLITGIHENDNPGLIQPDIFPNPFDDILNVTLPDGDVWSSLLTIYDVTGRLIYQEIHIPPTEQIEINTSGFSPGVYILSVQCPGKLYSAKLIKY
jgi:hypothetical protein